MSANDASGLFERVYWSFFCAVNGDETSEAQQLATKLSKLRILEDDAGKMNRSVTDIEGSVLVVNQFRLAANTRQGNRPSFISTARPDSAIPLMVAFICTLESLGLVVETGEFGASIAVHLINDGPCGDMDRHKGVRTARILRKSCPSPPF